MQTYILIIIFIFGITIGSFLNVCIYRIPRGESISFPPSHCTVCKNRLKPYHLIPIFSYLFLRGKCAYCGEKISIRYPIIEFLNGLLWVFLYYISGRGILSFVLMPIGSVILVMIAISIDKLMFINKSL